MRVRQTIRQAAAAIAAKLRSNPKEHQMDEATQTAVNAAIAQAIEAATPKIVEAAGAAIGEKVAASMAEALKPVADRLGAVEAAAQAGGKKADAPGDDAPVTVKALTEALAARDAAAATAAEKARTDGAATAGRDAYAAEKMKDVPAAYRALMPATADAAALATAEQDVRAKFKADAAAAGFKLPDVGAAAPAGASAGTVDPSKLSPTQKIAAGLAAEQKS